MSSTGIDELLLADLNAVLRPQGVRITSLSHQVNYAGACQMRKQQSVHLVIGSPAGPITVLLMPGEYVAMRQSIKNQRFQGIILPTANGSMAIVGEDSEQVRQIEQELMAGLHSIS